MPVTHEYVSETPDDPSDEVSSSEWNADHLGTNEHTHADANSGGTDLEPLTTHALAADAHHSNSDPGPDADITVDTAGGAGLSDSYARSQHGHRLDSSSATPEDVGSAASAGSTGAVSRDDHVHEGLHSISKAGSTALVGDVTLTGGANITLTQTGQDISIAGAGSSGLTESEIGLPITALTPSAVNGADPVEAATIGNVTCWGMSYPAGSDRYAEMNVPIPSYYDGGAIDAYMHWSADTSAALTLAGDNFTRVVASGLGTADVGGAYTLGGAASSFNVNGTQATVLHSASQERRGELAGASVGFLSGQLYFEQSWDKLITGTAAYVEAGMDFRTQDTSGSVRYRVIMRRRTDATVGLYVMRKLPTQTQIGNFETAITHTAGKTISVRVEVVGTSPTTIRVRAWETSGSEGGSWDIDITDSSAALQLSGGVALRSFSDTAVTNYNHTSTYDNWAVTTTGAGGTTCRWGVSALCLGDGTDIDGSTYGTEGTVDDDATAGNWLISGAAAFTPAGSPAGGKTLQLRIARKGTHANDDLANEAFLRGIRLRFDRT